MIFYNVQACLTFFLLPLGRVRYQINSLARGQQGSINKINEFIRNSQNESFNGTFALLVDWDAIHPAGFEEFVRNPSVFSTATANFLNSVSEISTKYMYIMVCNP